MNKTEDLKKYHRDWYRERQKKEWQLYAVAVIEEVRENPDMSVMELAERITERYKITVSPFSPPATPTTEEVEFM